MDPGALGDTIVTKERTHDGDAAKQQGVFVSGVTGSEGAYTFVDVAAGGGVEAAALRVTLASDSTGVVSVDDNGASLTVDNAALSVTGGGVEATALRVTLASDSTGVVSVDDNGGNLSIDDGGNSITVDNGGTFAVQVDGAALTSLQLADDVVFADDAAFTLASSKVAMAGAIRDDSLSALTAIEGDAVPLRVGSTGALHVNVASGGITGIAEDSASAGGEEGVMMLAVRRDAASSGVSADGDFAALSVTSDGSLRVSGGGGGTEYTVDAAAPAAPTGATFVMERDDALSALTEIEGDWTNPRASANGALWVSVDGTVTVGSHAVTNAGTFAVQVDGNALTALQLIDDPVFADDAAFTIGTSKVMVAGFTADEASTDSLDEGDAGAARITLDRKLITTPYPHTAGGLSIFRSLDLDETEEEVKATAGQVYAVWVTNTATTTRWLKFYNLTAANTTVGTSTPVITIGIPGNTSDDISGNFGPGGMGIAFDTAITVAATTGVADADTGAPAANDVIVNIFYK